jgi:hypothetical protein
MSGSGSAAQFQQLQMFATPKELGNLRSGDNRAKKVSDVRSILTDMVAAGEYKDSPSGYRGGASSPADYLDRMKATADTEGGIEHPVHIWHPTNGDPATLIDGHHRAAVALETNRLVPVVHHDNSNTDLHKHWPNYPKSKENYLEENVAYGSAFMGQTRTPTSNDSVLLP